MFRILQLHRSIRRFTSVTNNVTRITSNHQPVRFYSSALAALKEDALAQSQTPSIQNVLMDIQNNLKDYGRISNKLVLDLSDCVAQTDRVNSTQALAAIRCFTDLSVDMKPENRIKRVDSLWQRLEKLCVHLEVGHYNALLRAYLDSEHDFNPTDFLAKMAENGVGPNRITYQFLVERYCQTGDVNGASRIMRFMEEKEVPITQNILNLMIMGHARNNDIESAEDVLNVMKSKGLTPDESTYGLLLSEYARKGEVDRILRFFADEKSRDIFLDSRSVSNMIFQLVSNGHQESVQKVLHAAPTIIRSEFHRLVHRLVSAGHAEACLPLLEGIQNYPEGFVDRLSSFVVGQYAAKAKSAEEVINMINAVPKSDVSVLYMVALRGLLTQGEGKSAIDLVSSMTKDGIQIRTHMYFPLVARLAKNNDIKELADVIIGLKDKLSRFDVYTIYKILKTSGWNTQPSIDVLLPLRRYGTAVKDCLMTALNQRHPGEAIELSSQPLRTVVCATNTLVSRSVLYRFPEAPFVDVATNIIARGLRGVDEDSESDSEVAEEAAVDQAADAAADAAADVESVSEETETKTAMIPYAKLLRMTPQELTDTIVSGIAKNLRHEDKCSRILNAFKERGLGISQEVADDIARLCNSVKVKEALEGLASVKSEIPDKNYNMKIDARSDILEEYINNDKISDQYLKTLLKNKLVIALSAENNSRVCDVVKELGDNIMPSALGAFIRYACNNNDTALGLECWSKYSKKRGVSLHFVTLAINLIKEGKIDEAMNIINEKKTVIKDRPRYKIVQSLLITLSSSSDERCINALKELSTEGSDRSLYLGHLNSLIKKDQLTEAVDLLESSVAKYGRYGLRNLGVVLVEKEKYELLQRVQNILSSTFGEEDSLFELSLVLLKCRKVRQAKRIVELSGQPSRIVARVLSEGDLASLESMVEVLPTFHPRRDELCEQLLEIYDKKNDAESALALYTRFEEEKFTPTNKFLFVLRNLLSRCGYEIPFDQSVLSEESVRESSRTSKPRKAPETVNRIKEEDCEAALLATLDKDREAFKKVLSGFDTAKKNALIDDLVKEAIRQKNFERIKFLVPDQQKPRFHIFLRLLGDETLRNDYVDLMKEHVEDMSDMLKAYWFSYFLKGDDRTCADLWLQYSMYSMIFLPKFSVELLQGHEERYYAFFDKISAPPENRIGAFVLMCKKKAKESAKECVEFLEKNAETIKHVNGPTLLKLKKILEENEASSESLAKYDDLVKKHGINVNEISS